MLILQCVLKVTEIRYNRPIQTEIDETDVCFSCNIWCVSVRFYRVLLMLLLQ